jgi:hypothetical protein
MKIVQSSYLLLILISIQASALAQDSTNDIDSQRNISRDFSVKNLLDQNRNASDLLLPFITPVHIPYYWAMDFGLQFGASPRFIIPSLAKNEIRQVVNSRIQLQGYQGEFGVRVHGDAISSSPFFGSILRIAMQYQTFTEQTSIDNIQIIDINGTRREANGAGHVNTERFIGGIGLTVFYNFDQRNVGQTFFEAGILTEKEIARSQTANIHVSLNEQDSVIGDIGKAYRRDCRCIETRNFDQSFDVGVGVVVGIFHQLHFRMFNRYAYLTPFIRFKIGVVKPKGVLDNERSVVIGIGVIFPMQFRYEDDADVD